MPVIPGFPVIREEDLGVHTDTTLNDGTYYSDPIELDSTQKMVQVAPILSLGSGSPSDVSITITAQVKVEPVTPTWVDLNDADGGEQWSLTLTTDYSKAVTIGDDTAGEGFHPQEIAWSTVRLKIVISGSYTSAGDDTSSLTIYAAVK